MEHYISFLNILFSTSRLYVGREQKHSEGPSLRWSIVPSTAASIDESESSAESSLADFYILSWETLEVYVILEEAFVVIVID